MSCGLATGFVKHFIRNCSLIITVLYIVAVSEDEVVVFNDFLKTLNKDAAHSEHIGKFWTNWVLGAGITLVSAAENVHGVPIEEAEAFGKKTDAGPVEVEVAEDVEDAEDLVSFFANFIL